MLHGRADESAALAAAIDRARDGTGTAIVLRGEAGIGKTALLDHAAGHAEGMRVLRATGVESESELAFAGLHQLLRPVLGLLGELPDPQADALRAALGLAAATSPDRFLVASAVLSLIAEAAAGDGALCLLDDVQWMDQASADALLFTARRLAADRVVMVFAERAGSARSLHAPELTAIDVAALTAAQAASLLAQRVSTTPDGEVARRLARLTAGNPLALVEVARLLTADQLAGRAPLPEPLPVTEGLQRAFLGQVRRLEPETQLILLIIAIDTTGELGTVLAAAGHLGVPAARIVDAESAGLIVLDEAGPRIRHPLIRSAVAAGASHTQRMLVNRALADALVAAGDPDRGAWHAAAACTGTDNAIAAELAAAAGRASARGAHAAAARAYDRAAQLSVERTEQARLYVSAARAAWLGGLPDAATAALAAARPRTDDPMIQAEIAELHGLSESRRGNASEAARSLTAAARMIADRAPSRALALLVQANYAANFSTDLGTVLTARKVAETIGPGADPVDRLAWHALVGYGAVLAGESELGVRHLRAVVDGADGGADLTPLMWACSAALILGDEVTACRLGERAAHLARVADMTGSLPFVLEHYAMAESLRGRLASATALATEGVRLARESGQLSSVALNLSTLSYVAAIRGDFAASVAAAEEALGFSVPRRLGLVTDLATWSQAVCDMMRGRYPAALERLTALGRSSGPHSAGIRFAYIDWVEAAVRCGEPDVAVEALDLLGGWVTDTSGPRLRALLLRARALLAAGEEAGDLYDRSVALHPPDEAPVDLARTHLLYGEWLRRARRTTAARRELRTALDVFTRVGADPLVERASAELRAAGEATRQPEPTAINQLTAQELQIARLVAGGASNRDVATRLFISPRTVEYHLYKIYPKLGVASRMELARFLAAESTLAASA